MSAALSVCQVIPETDRQVSFRIQDREPLRWHFGSQYPRPCFYPLRGPGGASLTRMGHPGAPNHDHHQSVWFAHNSVAGVDFWSNNGPAHIRQNQWYVYEDGEVGVMAAALHWYDGHDPKELLRQDLVAALRPLEQGEYTLELQSTFVPTASSLEFGKTNFGFLAVRVARTISEFFGGGTLTNSEGQTGEAAIFGKPARWMDYSGPVDGKNVEGITYFDHPGNPRHPSVWHVREDGWMGASFCFHEPYATTQAAPLRLRYLLHAHRGPCDAARAEQVAGEFAKLPAWAILKSTKKHRHYEAVRQPG